MYNPNHSLRVYSRKKCLEDVKNLSIVWNLGARLIAVKGQLNVDKWSTIIPISQWSKEPKKPNYHAIQFYVTDLDVCFLCTKSGCSIQQNLPSSLAPPRISYTDRSPPVRSICYSIVPQCLLSHRKQNTWHQDQMLLQKIVTER